MRTPQTTPSSQPGKNRTGILPHPDLLEQMVEGTAEFRPTSRGGPEMLADVRVRYAKDAEPAGTMPPATKLPVERLPLLDKLGARLQFERTGTRLYEALISKLDAYGTFASGPSREDLVEIRDEEHRHALLVQEIITKLGGDPTAITPCANLQGTASRGIGDVLLDPRTNLLECLEIIIIAELADVESWRSLVVAAEPLGNAKLVEELREAEKTEEEHLLKVRSWIAAGQALREKAR